MASDPTGPGRSHQNLLDRLNALKGMGPGRALDANDTPGLGNRGGSAGALSASLEPVKPKSREDALAERLRSLRNTPERELDSSPSSPAPAVARPSPTPDTERQAPGRVSSSGSIPLPAVSGQDGEKHAPARPAPQPGCEANAGGDDQAALPPGAVAGAPSPPPTDAPTPSQTKVPGDDVKVDINTETAVEDLEPHLQTDDQELADLLADVGPDDPADWLLDTTEETDQVKVLLDGLSKPKRLPHGRHGDARPGSREGKERGNRSDDDSEGEEMKRQVEEILSKAMDEAKLEDDFKEQVIQDDHAHAPAVAPPSSTPSASSGTGDQRPSVPNHESRAGSSDHAGRGRERDADTDDGSDPLAQLSLPSVPSTNPLGAASSSPSSSSKAHSQAPAPDFETSMAARMAALRSPPTTQPKPPTKDDRGDGDGDGDGGLNLPSVPTSLPSAKSLPSNAKRLASKTGYTDEDMETWCVACLDDGTLICPGCDDDVFCSRCWHEMHLGPMAGYEERQHRPKHFHGDKKKKEKRVLVGAS